MFFPNEHVGYEIKHRGWWLRTLLSRSHIYALQRPEGRIDVLPDSCTLSSSSYVPELQNPSPVLFTCMHRCTGQAGASGTPSAWEPTRVGGQSSFWVALQAWLLLFFVLRRQRCIFLCFCFTMAYTGENGGDNINGGNTNASTSSASFSGYNILTLFDFLLGIYTFIMLFIGLKSYVNINWCLCLFYLKHAHVYV